MTTKLLLQRTIKTLCLIAAVALANLCPAQTNVQVLSVRDMTVVAPAVGDYIPYFSLSGTNYYWRKSDAATFYATWLNMPVGLTNTATLATHLALINSNAANYLSLSNKLYLTNLLYVAALNAEMLARTNAITNALVIMTNLINLEATNRSSVDLSNAAVVTSLINFTATQAVINLSNALGGYGTLTAGNMLYSLSDNVVPTNGTSMFVTNDLSFNSSQIIDFPTNVPSSSKVWLYVSNPSAGQRVSVYLRNNSANSIGLFLGQNLRNFSALSTNLSTSIGAKKVCQVIYTAIDNQMTNVLFNAANQQN